MISFDTAQNGTKYKLVDIKGCIFYAETIGTDNTTITHNMGYEPNFVIPTLLGNATVWVISKSKVDVVLKASSEITVDILLI